MTHTCSGATLVFFLYLIHFSSHFPLRLSPGLLLLSLISNLSTSPTDRILLCLSHSSLQITFPLTNPTLRKNRLTWLPALSVYVRSSENMQYRNVAGVWIFLNIDGISACADVCANQCDWHDLHVNTTAKRWKSS